MNKKLLLIGLMITAFILNIDLTVMNLALITISKNFGSSLHNIQWALTSYVFCWAICIVPFGKLADMINVKNILFTGYLIFLLAATMGALAQNATAIIIGRGLQGVGASIIIAASYKLIANIFSEELSMAFSYIGGAAGLGIATGPFIGGILIKLINWRAIFIFNITLGLLALLLLIFTLKNKQTKETLKLQTNHLVGLFFMGLCIASLIFLINSIMFKFSSQILYSLTTFLTILASFVFYLKYINKKFPIPLSLITSKTFLIPNIGYFIFQFAFSTILLIPALYLQIAKNVTPTTTSYFMLMVTVPFALSTFVFQKINKKLSAIFLIIFCFTVGGIAFISIGISAYNNFYFLITLTIIGICLGIISPALNVLLMSKIENKNAGIGASIFNMIGALSNGLGVLTTTFITLLITIRSIPQNTFNINAKQLHHIVSTAIGGNLNLLKKVTNINMSHFLNIGLLKSLLSCGLYVGVIFILVASIIFRYRYLFCENRGK